TLLVWQASEQFLVGWVQGPADLGDDLGQLPTRDGQADPIADELADGRVRGVTDPLEVGDDGGQPRPGQATALDRQREWGVTFLPATGTPPRMAAVLVDLQGHGGDVDLLDHDRRAVVGQEQVPSATGAGVQKVVGGRGGEPLGREELALVRGMAW